MDAETRDQNDPLGIKKLGALIESLDKPAVRGDAQALALALQGLRDGYRIVLAGYENFCDRYRLLKQSSQQLFEEVAWLRDQCDDFCVEALDTLDTAATSAKE